MDYLGEIAKGGFGYLLFVGSLTVIFWQNKKINELYDKRIEDGNLYRGSFIETARDLLNAQRNLQKSVDAITDVLESLRWRNEK